MEGTLARAETRGGRARVTLRTLLRLRLALGLYCAPPPGASLALRLLAPLYCIFLGSINSVIVLTNLSKNPIRFFDTAVTFFEYNVNFLVSLLTSDHHLLYFCEVIEQADKDMGFDSLPLITPRIRTIFIVLCVNRIISVTLNVASQLRTGINLINSSIFMMFSGVHFTGLINIIALDLLRDRLALLRRFLKFSIKRHNWSANNIDGQIEAVNHCLKIYKTLIDNFNATFTWTKLRILISLVCAFVVFLLHGREVIQKLKYERSISVVGLGLRALGISSAFLVASLPAVFAELAAREVENLKLAIANKLLECQDEQLCAALERATEYLELRPYSVRFIRACTLDASLVLTFASLCATYLIVIIQISGLV